MSGYFQKKHKNVSRMSLNTMIELRDYFSNIINPEDTELTDYFGNHNLLLPNPLDEKSDYGDMDIFLYTTLKPEEIIQLLNHNGEILDIRTEENDHIYSLYFLYKGHYYQVDITITDNYNAFVYSIFNYYRVPYFMFLLGLFFYKVGLNIGIHGIYYKQDTINNQSSYVYLDKDIIGFIELAFGFSREDLFNIHSFNGIAEYMNNSWLPDYDFVSGLKSEHKSKVTGNEKIADLLSKVRDPIYSIEDAKSYIYGIILKYYYNELTIGIENAIAEYHKKNELKKGSAKDIELRSKLCYIFQINDVSEIPKSKHKIIKDVKLNLDYYYNLALEKGIYQ